MAYTVLNKSLQVKGKLTLNNGQGGTTFFADTITQQLATDNSSDPANSTAMAFNEYDKQGNAKQWGHSITISVEATDLGASITTNDYLMYFDDVNNHYYLMKVITAETDRNSGFVTISGINTAIYELGKQIVNDETTFKQANLQAVVNGLYKNAPFSVIIQDDLATVIDYTVSANTSLQAVLQDLQTKYNVDVDSWIELDESGNISDRIIYLGHIGRDNGELIRYGGAKGFENINAQELSDTIYTKLYVTGLTDDKNPTKGHIGSVNNGMEFITDDNANAKQYAIGASQQQPVYLEGSITNTLLSEPQALLTWAKSQMGIFNHPRFNYTVTPLHDQVVGIGDTIAVQDFHIKPEILVTSKVIQKSTSFASPETNTFVLGEFSSIFTENANKGAGVIQLIKKDVTVVQEAADNARASAEAAHEQAVQAQQAAIHAQTTADGKKTTFTFNSVDDLPATANQGDQAWVTLSDGTHGYTYLNDKWVEDINPTLAKDITDGVTSAVNTAKANTDASIQANNALTNQAIDSVSKANATALINAGDFTNKAQAMADKALADAKTNTAQAAQDALNSANQNLADAKKSLTDGISKEASDRASAVATANSQAQSYTNQAKADALNTIAKEVTDRQNAVSALDTKATNAVNQAKSDINDTINALSVGGRNYIVNSDISSGTTLTDKFFTSVGTSAFSNQMLTLSVQVDYDNITNLAGDKRLGFLTFLTNTDGNNIWFGAVKNPNIGDSFHGRVSVTTDLTNINTLNMNSNRLPWGILIEGVEGSNVSVSRPKLEIGNKATDWINAPEDVVLDYTTKDNQIKETITQYQTTNDGKVTKAQTDATTALGQVTTKVSQTDYDQKTGDLSSKYTQVKQTVDSQATDIVDIKATATSQASKINSISSDVDGTKQSISDINTEQGKQSSKINQISSDVDGTKQSITDIQTKDGTQDTRMGTIETSVSGVKSDFSTYKTDADGRISTAQTTAQTAVDGLKTKVSQTDYNTKTGQLQTDLTTTTQTANQAKTDIISIKQTDTSQDSRMNTIESDASGTKQTVSQLQTVQGQQSGSISTLQQRADGFDATVTKVDNLSVGGRNLLLNSKILSWGVGTNTATTSTRVSYDSTTNMWHITSPKGGDYNAGIFFYQSGNVSNIITNGQQWAFSFDIKGTGVYSQFGIEGSSPFNKISGNVPTDWTRVSSTGTAAGTGTKSIIIYFNSVDVALDVYIKLPTLETGNVPTDYTPAPEDIESALAQVKITADGVSSIVSNPTTGLSVRVQTAEGTLSTATNNISGLTTKQTTLAGQVTQEISDRQNGDNNTLNSAANYTSSQISNSETNMKSLINQKADSVIVGTIQGDVSALKSANNWQQISYDDLNFLKTQGNYFITGGKNLNTPINNWFYITVDAPTSSRITQHVWKDLDATLSYVRTFDGTNWSAWVQQVSSSTLLTIFKDSWSLGTSVNNGITNQMIAGINGQPDGSLHLKGSSITLDGSTVVTGSFTVGQANIANGAIGNAQIGNAVIDSSKIANLDVSKLTGDTITGFNITAIKQITLASGASLQSDVVNMDKTSISILAQNVSVHRVSPEGYTVGALGTFQLKSNFGAILSDGVISVTKPNETKPYRIGTFHSGYGTNNMYLQAVDYDDGSLNEYVDLSSAQLNMINTDKSQKVINSMSVTAGGIATTGSITTSNQVWAGNIGINGFHSFISQDNQDFWLGAGNGGSVGMVGKSWKNSSLKSLKENFINVDPEYALNELLKTDIRSYNFRGDKVTDNYVSPIIDDVEGKLYIPKDFLDSTGKSVKTYSIDGYLIQAIKALQEQITELKQG